VQYNQQRIMDSISIALQLVLPTPAAHGRCS
jgi:hypothetical protein